MGITSIDFEKSRTFEAPANWLFFVLVNPDIMAKINNAPLKLGPGRERRSFDGKIWGVTVHLDISGDQEQRAEGMVDILANVKKFGKTHTFARYKYKAIDNKTTLVELRFNLQTSGILMLALKLLVQKEIDSYLQQVFNHLENAAQLLNKDAAELKDLLSAEQHDRVNNYRGAYPDVNVKFSPQDFFPARTSDLTAFKTKVWDRELQDLLSLHGEYQGKIDSLKEELNRIVEARDEVGTLLYARRTLEIIASHLCEIILNRPKGKDPLAQIIDLLHKSGSIPENVCTSMKNLNSLGNYGAHPKEFSPRQVREALAGLCSIMEWYVKIDEKKLAPGNSPSLAYKLMCQKFYDKSLPSIEQRRELENKRKELGITREDALSLERSAIPAEVRELQIAIETIYVDGKINDSQRQFLNSKANELGITAELAEKVIREFCEKMEDSINAEYRALCQRFYFNSIPTAEQKQGLRNEARRLGLAEEEAAKIEEECIPQKVKLLKIAIETIYVDGKIDENKKKFLDMQAEKLGINPELAARVIEEYCGRMENSLELKYLLLCKEFYSNSFPSFEEKQLLEQNRIKLGITKPDALRIENSCLSDECREYLSALEGVYSDGFVQKSEREFLNKKAAELGISSDSAARMESHIQEIPRIKCHILCNALYSSGNPSPGQISEFILKCNELGLSEKDAQDIQNSYIRIV